MKDSSAKAEKVFQSCAPILIRSTVTPAGPAALYSFSAPEPIHSQICCAKSTEFTAESESR